MRPTQDNIYETFINNPIGRDIDVILFSQMINQLDRSFSISLDSRWGSGKTFFVKQTKMVLDAYNDHIDGDLENDKKIAVKKIVDEKLSALGRTIEFEPQVTVYFDAWENDYLDDPLLSLVYEILENVHSDFEFNDEKNVVSIVASIFECATSRNTKGIIDALRSDNPLDEIKKQKNLHSLVSDFLESVLSEHGNRLVIFVDELDRCKPSYAVQLLERVKHYFDNSRITFVFSMNSEALQHTICNYYGHNFDATRYLERFFDLSMSLTPINNEQFCDFIGAMRTSSVFDETRRDVIEKYDFEMRDILRYYMITSVEADKPAHSRDWRETPENLAWYFSLVYVIPIATALRMTSITKYEDFIYGRSNADALIEILEKKYDSFFCQSLLMNDESYEEEKRTETKPVKLSDKLTLVYEALFQYQYSGSDHCVYIGACKFTRRVRDWVLYTLSALSNNADYDFVQSE